MTGGNITIDRPLLRKGLLALNADYVAFEEVFVEYINLLQKWNRVYNLTAILNVQEVVVKHFFDSLSIAPYLCGNRILDVGTGAGFPGLPLAIVEPKRTFILLDSQIKKIHFLEVIKSALKLSHVEIFHARVEDFLPEPLCDTVIARAFGSLRDIQEKTQHFLAPQGQILAMKGQYPLEELQDFDENSFKVHALNVPFLDQARHLVCLRSTNKGL
jgi:16S rRNA (guanine527-N7)-methyltransferase